MSGVTENNRFQHMDKYDLIIVTHEAFPYGMAATNRLLSYARELGKGYKVKVIVVRPSEREENMLNTEVKGSFCGVDFEYSAGTTIWPFKRNKFVKLMTLLRAYCNLKKLLKAHRPASVIYVSRSQVLAYLLNKWSKACKYKLFREISELAVIPANSFRRRLLAKSIRNARGHIAMTGEIVNQMHALGNGNTMLLPMSVDIERFPLDAPHQRQKYFFYCCGATWERDGALDFLQAFEKFCDVVPEYELHMAGSLTPGNSYHDQVRDFIQNSRHTSRMKLLGKLPTGEIPALLMNSSAAVMSPSQDYASGGFPTKLGEYLASNVPVICTAVSELPQYLDRSNAFITTPGNVDELSEFMQQIVRDPVHAAQVAANGRKVVEKYFVVKSYAERLAEFLEIKPYKKHIGFLAPGAYNYFHGKGFGGAELQIRQFARMFCDAGYKVTVLTSDCRQPRREFCDGIHIEYAPLRFLGGSNLYFFIDSWRIARQIKKLHFDWCFFKNPNTALFQLALARKLDKNLRIAKIFASDDDCVNHGRLPDKLYFAGLKKSDHLIFQTKHQQHITREKLNMTGTVIPNIFFPPEAPESPVVKDIDVLWVGAFNQIKCPEKFYEIAAKLPQYRFTAISKPVNERYKDLAEKIESLDNVDFAGTVPFEQTTAYFRRAKVYLCTSEVEGFPNTFLQAWYENTPVVSVTFPCDGVIDANNSGFVSGSLEQAVKDITTLLEDGDLCKKMGVNGRKYLENNHLPLATLQKFENLIKEFQDQ